MVKGIQRPPEVQRVWTASHMRSRMSLLTGLRGYPFSSTSVWASLRTGASETSFFVTRGSTCDSVGLVLAAVQNMQTAYGKLKKKSGQSAKPLTARQEWTTSRFKFL